MTNSKRRFWTWLLIPLVWLSVALLNSMEPATEILGNGHMRAIPWMSVFFDQLRHYFWWVVVSPLVVLITRRFSFAPGRMVQSILVQIPASLVVASLFVLLRMLPIGLKTFSYKYPPNLANMRFLLPGAVGIYWLIVALVTAFEAFTRYLEKQREAVQLRAELGEAQLAMLRMQLEPHFLFNALNTVAALIETRPVDARRMITLLGDLLRDSLDARPANTLPLEEELDWIERYLEIQTVRFRDRLQVKMDVEPRALRALVPTLILQPLVENAIKHGLEPSTGSVLVTIRAQVHDDQLELTVLNNGAELLEPQPAEGIGLSNTRNRLMTLYGENQQSTLHNTTNGVEAKILLPFTTTNGNGHHA